MIGQSSTRFQPERVAEPLYRLSDLHHWSFHHSQPDWPFQDFGCIDDTSGSCTRRRPASSGSGWMRSGPVPSP